MTVDIITNFGLLYAACITALANIVLAGGVIIAYQQVRAAQKSLKAQTLIKLSDEWRRKDIYEAVSYIHLLRREWKHHPYKEWDNLAKKWVEEHADNHTFKIRDEWMKRRIVSQFISKIGLLMIQNYLTRTYAKEAKVLTRTGESEYVWELWKRSNKLSLAWITASIC